MPAIFVLLLLSQSSHHPRDFQNYESGVSWWSKYNYSMGQDEPDYAAKKLDHLMIYPGELEDHFDR